MMTPCPFAFRLLDRNVKKSGNSELDEVNESDEALIIEARDRYIMTLKVFLSTRIRN